LWKRSHQNKGVRIRSVDTVDTGSISLPGKVKSLYGPFLPSGRRVGAGDPNGKCIVQERRQGVFDKSNMGLFPGYVICGFSVKWVRTITNQNKGHKQRR
jgi:hypothetical protein